MRKQYRLITIEQTSSKVWHKHCFTHNLTYSRNIQFCNLIFCTFGCKKTKSVHIEESYIAVTLSDLPNFKNSFLFCSADYSQHQKNTKAFLAYNIKLLNLTIFLYTCI